MFKVMKIRNIIIKLILDKRINFNNYKDLIK
jgi:hypothetical protein